MKIRLLSIGTRLPGWVNEGYQSYVRRLPRDNALLLEEIPLAKHRDDTARRVADEGARMLKRLSKDEQVIALDERGANWSSADLAVELDRWRHGGRDVALLIGGPDGLSDDCLGRADSRWSLSPHTLPHGLARLLVAEQIYRAWTLLSGHPYHRA